MKNNNIITRIDLGKRIKDTESLDKYLKSIDSNFQDEINKNIKPYQNSGKNYNLCVDACCSYRLFKVNDKMYVQMLLTNHLDYVISEEDRVCMPYLSDLEGACKKVTIVFADFIRALEVNGFTYAIDIDKDNFEMIKNGNLDYITGNLNITKNYWQLPKKTQEEKSRSRLTLKLLYPDNKKWF